MIDIGIMHNYKYLRGKPGKNLIIEIKTNGRNMHKVNVGTLVQIKSFYIDLKNLLIINGMNNPIIYRKIKTNKG